MRPMESDDERMRAPVGARESEGPTLVKPYDAAAWRGRIFRRQALDVPPHPDPLPQAEGDLAAAQLPGGVAGVVALTGHSPAAAARSPELPGITSPAAANG